MFRNMPMRVPIGRGLFAIVDDEDFELVSNYRWHPHRSRDNALYYASTNVKMHRLVTKAPLGVMVDHINGDALDNRRCNLRLCTNAQNQQNTRSRGGTSQYKGVSFIAKAQKWLGSFVYEGERYHCGLFESEQECARAVDKARQEVCGEFALLNFPHTDD